MVKQSEQSIQNTEWRAHDGFWGHGDEMSVPLAVTPLALSAIPATLSLWFLFLHMLGQLSAAVRGSSKDDNDTK
ncbi:MAG TPA: hypothetical protein VGJ84_07385 [Polyangiaceae bacterium]|jgi:hypothetical protein